MSIQELISETSKNFDVTPKQLTSPSRKQKLVFLRYSIAALAYNQGYKYHEIAAAFHKKNVSTISHARKATTILLSNDKYFRSIYNHVKTIQGHVLPTAI